MFYVYKYCPQLHYTSNKTGKHHVEIKMRYLINGLLRYPSSVHYILTNRKIIKF